ncbi:MAG: ATP-binding protein [Eubacteriales bacterium]|nr:ATP-binding protein [Eubacteriales bacterium]
MAEAGGSEEYSVMSLTREQYTELMNIYSSRRSTAYKIQSRRQEEVEEQIPAIRVYKEEAAALAAKEIEAGFGRNNEDPAKLKKQRAELGARSRRLLEEAGFGADYLDIPYTCSECKDTGFIGNKKCGCYKQLESQFINRQSGLPAAFEKDNFASFDPYIFDDEEIIRELLPRKITQYEYMTENVMSIVRDFIDEFGTSGGKNILMMGPPGTGKTFLSNCMAKALIDRQHTVVYERAGEMFELMSGMMFGKTRSESAERRAEHIEKSELLIIDDLGTEFMTDYSKAKFFSLISNRLSAGLSTIISTNLSLNQLSSIYGERVTSRFMGEYILMPLYGSDLRVRKRGGSR